VLLVGVSGIMCWGIFGVSLVAAHDVIDQGAPPSNTAWWDGYIELVDEKIHAKKQGVKLGILPK